MIAKLQPVYACERCGTEWTGRKKKYCSSECQRLSRKQHSLTCSNCGGEFQSHDKSRKYCCHNCSVEVSRRGVRWNTCRGCGGLFVPKSGGNKGLYCSRECSFAHKGNARHIQAEPIAKASKSSEGMLVAKQGRHKCGVGGGMIAKPSRTTRLCSRACRLEDGRRKSKEMIRSAERCCADCGVTLNKANNPWKRRCDACIAKQQVTEHGDCAQCGTRIERERGLNARLCLSCAEANRREQKRHQKQQAKHRVAPVRMGQHQRRSSRQTSSGVMAIDARYVACRHRSSTT